MASLRASRYDEGTRRCGRISLTFLTAALLAIGTSVSSVQAAAHKLQAGIRVDPLEPIPSRLGRDQMLFSGKRPTASAGTTKPLLMIGVFTYFPEPSDCGSSTDKGAEATDIFSQRREAARGTWMQDALADPHLLIRFITPAPDGPVGQARLKAEVKAHGDVWVIGKDAESPEQAARRREAVNRSACVAGRLDEVMSPEALRWFFRAVMKEHASLQYIGFMDDSAFLMPQRLLSAADQWAAMKADYIGCMKYDTVPEDDPLFYMLAVHYPLHATAGSPVVLSAHAVRNVVMLGYDTLRLEGRGDVAMALWMLTSNVTYYDDRRLCLSPVKGPKCSPTTVALYNPTTGGPDPRQTRRLYHVPSCRVGDGNGSSDGQVALPYLPSRTPVLEDYMAPMRI